VALQVVDHSQNSIDADNRAEDYGYLLRTPAINSPTEERRGGCGRNALGADPRWTRGAALAS
jgi:hypothetical protein